MLTSSSHTEIARRARVVSCDNNVFLKDYSLGLSVVITKPRTVKLCAACVEACGTRYYDADRGVYMYIWYETPYGTVVVDWMELMKEPSWVIVDFYFSSAYYLPF